MQSGENAKNDENHVQCVPEKRLSFEIKRQCRAFEFECLKAGFHFNRTVAKRSVFHCIHIICSA